MGNFFKDTLFLGALDQPEFEPSSEVKLTPGGEKLETGLYESIKSDLFPENLAAQFIGQAKKVEQARQKRSSQLLSAGAATGPQTAVGGGIARGLISEGRARLAGGPAGVARVGGAKREFALNRLGNLQNFMNLQSQTPLLRNQANLLSDELAQQRGADAGAMIGGMAQIAAMGMM
ncbi:MAG: hypothetical protein ACYSTJ_10375 [Planctomycetota bacterium]|jgi:hypothetical protein